MRLLILSACALMTSVAFGKEHNLKNFSPGQYKLTEGKIGECGDGEFVIRDEGKNVGLGALHGFNLESKIEQVKGDAPGDEGCVYEAKDGIDEKSDVTILTFIEQRKCKGALKHTLTKTAEVRDGKVHLAVNQTGTPNFHYSCDWTKVTR